YMLRLSWSIQTARMSTAPHRHRLPKRGNAKDDETIEKDDRNEDADDRPGDRADTAEEAGAAEDDGGDGREVVHGVATDRRRGEAGIGPPRVCFDIADVV